MQSSLIVVLYWTVTKSTVRSMYVVVRVAMDARVSFSSFGK